MKRSKADSSRRLSAEIWRFYLLVDTATVLVVVAAVFFIDAIQLFSTSLTVALARGATGILILLLSSWVSRRYVTRTFGPLHALSEGTKEIEKGNFHVQVENQAPNTQVGRLITDFNHMARELESVGIFRNDFINDFSHEFKTPIVSISGFAQRLLEEDLPPQKQREYIAIIAREAQRLSTLSKNVLLLNNYEHQALIPDKETFSLDEQLRLCVLARENQWTEKHLELDIDLEPITLTASSQMLSQVWDNLLSNAIKFSYPNGRLGVRCFRRGDKILVEIEDSGIGMDQAILLHAFDKFYQGDRSHAKAGNGLGLSIVKRILELCGGTISLFSRTGHGTTATVVLPADEVTEN